MATGIPRQRRDGDEILGDKSQAGSAALELTISYEGKKEKSEILRSKPAELERIWSTRRNNTGFENRLYFGENLSVLAALLTDNAVCGKVRLVYIDPPYASGGVFQSRSQEDAYDDLLLGAHYVEFLRERLILLNELLADNGSIYVHLDKNMAFAVKVVMDEVFGTKNFRSLITRKKCNPKNYTSKNYGNVSDFILFYTKTDNYVWNRAYEEWTDVRALKEYQYIDDSGRRYKKVPIHAPGVRNGETGKSWRGMTPPPGKHWQYTPSKLDELEAQGDIYWSPNGNPRRKVYFDGSAGVPVQDIWMDFRDAHNQNVKITGFPTEKNPELLARIIQASSAPGDLVLDCFCGSGTTLAVASQLERSWVGVDNSKLAIETTLRRFACGLKPMGDFVTARTALPNMQTELDLTVDLAGGDTQVELELGIEAAASHVADDFALIADTTKPHLMVIEDSDLLSLAGIFQNYDEEVAICGGYGSQT